MSDFIGVSLQTHHDDDVDLERARCTLAGRSQSLEEYGELCAMVLDELDAIERYERYERYERWRATTSSPRAS